MSIMKFRSVTVIESGITREVMFPVATTDLEIGETFKKSYHRVTICRDNDKTIVTINAFPRDDKYKTVIFVNANDCSHCKPLKDKLPEIKDRLYELGYEVESYDTPSYKISSTFTPELPTFLKGKLTHFPIAFVIKSNKEVSTLLEIDTSVVRKHNAEAIDEWITAQPELTPREVKINEILEIIDDGFKQIRLFEDKLSEIHDKIMKIKESTKEIPVESKCIPPEIHMIK